MDSSDQNSFPGCASAETEAVAASPHCGVNSVTGEGLAEVLKGASMVVDVSNAPSWEDSAVLNFFETSTRNLLKYGAEAGIKHFVALSVVGTRRRSESGYFRVKIAQEKQIKNATIPYSIVQATQFFEFLKGIAHFSMQGDKVHLPPVPVVRQNSSRDQKRDRFWWRRPESDPRFHTARRL